MNQQQGGLDPGPLFVATPPNHSIRRLLIANRGEIACRIIATCKLLGITSIAIYTDVDEHSSHVQLADEAVFLGPVDQPTGNPHQNGEVIVETALKHRADTIHPGYGYLSENTEFAKLVIDSGLIFVGPSVYAISVLGDKRQAKEFLIANAPEVPLIPGYNGKAQDLKFLAEEAKRIGFPVMIKAAAGGGGKGMRIVRKEEELEGELSRAQSEAQRSFGSSDCLLEKYIQHGKHVEVQLVGDSHGCVFSLLDRECSIQRRHQKIIEEAPCSWMDDELRTAMFDTAVTIGKLLSYEGAGTVEFMVDVEERKYYFLEVNTRIQVEHCISEEITRLDIVALQIYVAAGGRLEDCKPVMGVKPQGHAIECRLCAESPENDFQPALGLIRRWSPALDSLPAHQTSNVRFESGFRTGAVISRYFDSMIAKIVVWAPTRSLAIEKMLLILKNTVCIGVKTNHLFLQSCLCHPLFRDHVDYTTSFIPSNLPTLLENPYVKQDFELQQDLSVMAALFFRHVLGPSTTSDHPFKSLKGFRNQKADRFNIPSDIIRIPSSGQVIMITWTYKHGHRDPNTYHASTHPVNTISADDTKDEASDIAQAGAEIARLYSATISSTLADSTTGTSKIHTLRVLKPNLQRMSQPFDSKTQNPDWLLCDMTVQTSSYQKLDVHLATTSTSSPMHISLHTSLLGTLIEYQYFQPLQYGHFLRTSYLEKSQGGTGVTVERIYNAPMPCKVLSVPMKKGDEVKVGSVLCVIESMKTEIKIISSVAGEFNPRVVEGETLDEGGILCIVE